MENIELQFAIASILNIFVHLIVLIACIIILIKKQSIATILLFLGGLLSCIGFGGGLIYNAIAARNGAEALVNAQSNTHFF